MPNENEVECKLCYETFSSKMLFIQHFRTPKRKNREMLPTTDTSKTKTADTSTTLEIIKPYSTKTQFVCYFCTSVKRFESQEFFRKHITQVHKFLKMESTKKMVSAFKSSKTTPPSNEISYVSERHPSKETSANQLQIEESSQTLLNLSRSPENYTSLIHTDELSHQTMDQLSNKNSTNNILKLVYNGETVKVKAENDYNEFEEIDNGNVSKSNDHLNINDRPEISEQMIDNSTYNNKISEEKLIKDYKMTSPTTVTVKTEKLDENEDPTIIGAFQISQQEYESLQLDSKTVDFPNSLPKKEIEWNKTTSTPRDKHPKDKCSIEVNKASSIVNVVKVEINEAQQTSTLNDTLTTIVLSDTSKLSKTSKTSKTLSFGEIKSQKIDPKSLATISKEPLSKKQKMCDQRYSSNKTAKKYFVKRQSRNQDSEKMPNETSSDTNTIRIMH